MAVLREKRNEKGPRGARIILWDTSESRCAGSLVRTDHEGWIGAAGQYSAEFDTHNPHLRSFARTYDGQATAPPDNRVGKPQWHVSKATVCTTDRHSPSGN